MDDKPNNPQAFPIYYKEETKHYGETNHHNKGMTLRDYFAAKYLEGATAKYGYAIDSTNVEKRAKDAYKMADTMLKERENGK
jgi:hypothetical protein